MPIPTLTAEQREAALEKAAAVRRERAQLKARLKKGDLTLEEFFSLSQTSEVAGKMKVAALLESLPGVGKARAKTLMDRFEIAPTRRVRGLGENQLAKIRAEFGIRAGMNS